MIITRVPLKEYYASILKIKEGEACVLCDVIIKFNPNFTQYALHEGKDDAIVRAILGMSYGTLNDEGIAIYQGEEGYTPKSPYCYEEIEKTIKNHILWAYGKTLEELKESYQKSLQRDYDFYLNPPENLVAMLGPNDYMTFEEYVKSDRSMSFDFYLNAVRDSRRKKLDHFWDKINNDLSYEILEVKETLQHYY